LRPKNNLKEILSKINPETIIDVKIPRTINGYEVFFSYITIRGNKKENKRKVLLVEHDFYPGHLEKKFYEWIDKYNKEHEGRPYLKVKFLRYEFLGSMIED